MNQITTVNKMTSMEIAEVTGKLHHHIIRDIKDEIEKLENSGVSTETKFGLSERQDSTGRTIPYYILTKEGVLQLAARYDAVVRAKLIELAMKEDKPPVQIDSKFLFSIAAQLEEKEKQNLQLTAKIEQDKPLVMFAESCIASNDSLLVREVAKLASKKGIIIGEKRLWDKLREWGVVSQNREPYQKAFEAGWFETKQGTYSTPYGSETYRTYKVLPKGQIYIIERLKKEIA